MGTPEAEIFVDPSDMDSLPDVIDDFELEYNAGSDEWVRSVSNSTNLQKFTDSTELWLMNDLREGKPLLVLDLDHTLLDFSSKALQGSNASNGDTVAASLKRPFMDAFLQQCYR